MLLATINVILNLNCSQHDPRGSLYDPEGSPYEHEGSPYDPPGCTGKHVKQS